MTKNERACLLRKLKPLTWYYFCQVEAHPIGKDIPITKKAIQELLMIGESSLNGHLATWNSYQLIRRVQGGYLVTQMDGSEHEVSLEPVKRILKNSTAIIKYWCDMYEQHYGTPYVISSWAATAKQAGKLLVYPDEEIKAVFEVIISLYDTVWTNKQYPRPTLGAVSSWLFVQAQPYVVKSPEAIPEGTGSSESSSNLLQDITDKGWL
jgi:hypothetical protein